MTVRLTGPISKYTRDGATCASIQFYLDGTAQYGDEVYTITVTKRADDRLFVSRSASDHDSHVQASDLYEAEMVPTKEEIDRLMSPKINFSIGTIFEGTTSFTIPETFRKDVESARRMLSEKPFPKSVKTGLHPVFRYLEDCRKKVPPSESPCWFFAEISEVEHLLKSDRHVEENTPTLMGWLDLDTKRTCRGLYIVKDPEFPKDVFCVTWTTYEIAVERRPITCFLEVLENTQRSSPQTAEGRNNYLKIKRFLMEER